MRESFSALWSPRGGPWGSLRLREGHKCTLGGGRPPMTGVPGPFRALHLVPSGPPLGPLLPPRFVTEIGTASKTSFETTPPPPRTGRSAPEQVKHRVNSMSPISLPGRSGDTPGPLLKSQLAPPRAPFCPLEWLFPGERNRRSFWGGGRSPQGPWTKTPGLLFPIRALGPGPRPMQW